MVLHKRTSLTDSSQNVLEEIVSTDFAGLNETVVDRYNNFYVMYCDLADSIILYVVSLYMSMLYLTVRTKSHLQKSLKAMILLNFM